MKITQQLVTEAKRRGYVMHTVTLYSREYMEPDVMFLHPHTLALHYFVKEQPAPHKWIFATHSEVRKWLQ
jgi:hypothetical protein